MRVDNNALSEAEGNAKDNVGGLAGGSGDAEKLGHGFGNLAAKFCDELLGRAGDRLRLVVIEAGGSNFFLDGGN